MKTTILVFILGLSYFHSFGQISRENKNIVNKSEIGFLYYTDIEYPTFIPIKDQSGKINMAGFSTNTLGSGIQLNWQQLALDTLCKYEYKMKLLNYHTDSIEKAVILHVIPVKLNYKIYKYSKSKQQFRQNTNTDKLKLEDRYIVIKSFGGIPLEVDSVRAISILEN